MRRIDSLIRDEEFRRDWNAVLRIFDKHGINEVVLERIQDVEDVVSPSIEHVNEVAAINMWRIRGAQNLWEFLRNMTIEDTTTAIEEDYSGDL